MEVEGVEDGEVWFSEGDALSRFETGPGTGGLWQPSWRVLRVSRISRATATQPSLLPSSPSSLFGFFALLLSSSCLQTT